tara:strand:- start:379 stop:1071 length:693 start_codon:yes stop_codon:yes gene_type:complete
MKKLIEHFSDYPMVTDDTNQYRRYRMGRLKHQLWLYNRKRDHIVLDTHDKFIINNLKSGNTCVFGSAGYYLEDVVPNLTVIEQWPVVKKFYPNAQIIKDRSQIAEINGKIFDNFVVVNNRGDIWCELEVVLNHIANYVKSMKPGCLFFYSFRDTQIVDWNRLKINHKKYFYDFALQIEKTHDLNLLWHDIKFAKKQKDGAGNYDIMENPDTTNGNIKFVFEYKSKTKLIK